MVSSLRGSGGGANWLFLAFTVLSACGTTTRTGGSSSDGAGGAGGTSSGSGGGSGTGVGGNAAGKFGTESVDVGTLTRAIVVLNSCTVDDGVYRTETYLRAKQGGYQYPPLDFACLAKVKNGCEGVLACLGYETAAGRPDGCSGNTAIRGDTAWNCSKIGGGKCVDGTCLWPGVDSCDESTFVSTCDPDGRPVACDDHLNRGPVCSSFGLTCTVASFDSYCSGTGAACTQMGAGYEYFDVEPVGIACTGERLSACVRGKMAELDCSLFGEGFRCQHAGAAYFCGQDGECDPATEESRCDGNVAVICDAGKVRRVDCTSLGFVGCTGAKHVLCQSAQ